MATARKTPSSVAVRKPARKSAVVEQEGVQVAKKVATMVVAKVATKPAAKVAATVASKGADKVTKKAVVSEKSAKPEKALAPRVRQTRAADAGPHGDDDVLSERNTVAVQVPDLAVAVVRPDYWEKACQDLVKRDRIMKKLIPQFGPVHLKMRGDPFTTLARSIVGQQISVKAAQTVWDRLLLASPQMLPANVVSLGYERLAACGLSKRKAEYILDLAQHFVDGALHVDGWSGMGDEEVIAELIQIRGIGRWTAEMFLIFNLMRPNVLPLDDLGLIKAISVNYFSGEPVTRSEAREVAANWEPWRTVATWYMWRSLEPLPVVY